MFRSTLEEHDQIDPAETLMREVGAQLREARLERGEEIDQVAENLRIRRAYLEGIERGDLSIIPGRPYALGFLRSYADHLGFDGDDLINQIKSTVEDLTDHTRLHMHTPLPESRLPKTSLVILSLALVGGVYAGWAYLGHQDGQLDVETVAEVPDDLQRLALDSLPAAMSTQERQRPRTAPGTAGDPVMPAEPATSRDPAVETADPEGPPGVGPAARAGAGDEAPSGEDAVSPPAAPQPRTAEASAAAVPAPEATGDNAPEPSVTGADALDQIIAAERAGSAGAGGDDGSRPDAPVDRAERAADGETGASPDDDATIVPDAGPADQAGSITDESETAGATTGDAMASLEETPPEAAVDAEARPDAGSDAASDARAPGPDADRPASLRTAEDVLAALDSAGGGTEGTPQVHGRENTDARVVIRARERSWIRITSENGDYLRTRTLEEGEVLLVPDRADLTLWTGNAGGIEVIVDGRPLPAFGPTGTIKRDIPLDPESLVAEADAGRP